MAFTPVHGVVKTDGRKMFGRLPYLSDHGQSYYLDILIWRLNVRLQKARYFTEYLRCLYRWTWAPCEDYENFTPVFHDGDEGWDDEPGDNGEEEEEDDDDLVNPEDEEEWFLRPEEVDDEFL